jgi:hypothetical protein
MAMKKPITVGSDWLFLLIMQVEKPADGAFAVANPHEHSLQTNIKRGKIA